MNLLPATATKTFSLLSIGQRGVGKTVFLAGSHAELHPDNHSGNPQQFWFDCQDSDVQANLDKIKNHVARTGSYPPATIKITNFNFSLKSQSLEGVKTVCHFRWWDVPGEACNVHNLDFQEMILNSHGCCVFINAQALINDPSYPRLVEDIFNQVAAIASVGYMYNIKYKFALILTKCDLLEINQATKLKIEQALQPLITYLDNVKATYQTFYSAIPIVSVAGVPSLNPRGAANPLLWLLSRLNDSVDAPSEQVLASQSSQDSSTSQKESTETRKYILIISLLSVGLLGAIASFFFAFNLSTPVPRQVPTSAPNPTQTAN